MVVSWPDPTYERGSGDIRPIPWVSLMLITLGEKFFSGNHIAENIICGATLEILGYYSTMIQHFFGTFSTVHTASYGFLTKPEESP